MKLSYITAVLGFIVRSPSNPACITSFEDWIKKWEGQSAGTY